MTNKKNFQVPKLISLSTETLSYQTSLHNFKNHIRNLDKQVFCIDLINLFYTYNLNCISFSAKKWISSNKLNSSYIFSLDDSYKDHFKTIFPGVTEQKIDDFFVSSNNYIEYSSQMMIVQWMTKFAINNNINFFYDNDDLTITIDKKFLELLSQSTYGDDYPVIKHQILESFLPSNNTSSSQKLKI